MKVVAVIDRFEGNKAILLLGDEEIQVVVCFYKVIAKSEVGEGLVGVLHIKNILNFCKIKLLLRIKERIL